MALWKPDPTFYPSPRAAAQAPPEGLAYVATFDRAAEQPDALAVVSTDPSADDYGQVVGWLELPYTGDELHHFGWNACSSALCPYAPHPHVERRYLIVPGLRSSRVYVVDTKDDPRKPTLVKTLEPEELAKRADYSRPHTLHCGPEGLYVSNLGGGESDGPGGIAILDHESFEVLGRWEVDRGPQHLAYDFWWHLTKDVLVTSEWGTPSMIENGVVPELLLGKKYGHRLHFWDLRRRSHVQTVDLGEQYQMVLELRPAHDPTKDYGFVNVVVNVEDLSSSIWLWHRDGDGWGATKVIDIPAEPADPSQLPPAIQPFGAVPPLVADIDLSVDDRFLYVSAWGTGELRQYDVSDPFNPRQTGSVRIGGIVEGASHPAAAGERLRGGPQMVEVSRDGRRVYFTNSLYGAWDDQFYPEGVGSWLAKVDADPEGGIVFDPDFFVTDFRGRRPHQVRLQGGDASSDSYCYP
ncbi:MAG TPA: selenium-binding protein SBP56-related protein [Acidimicrobiales bacterium]